MRDRFADRLAFKARVTDEVVRAEIRKAVVQRQPALTNREVPSFGQVTKAEKGLIWLLVHQPADALGALAALDGPDFDGLASRTVLDLARKLNEDKGFSPSVLLERLTTVDAQLVTAIASEGEAHVNDAVSCARILRRLRLERELGELQRELNRLQELDVARNDTQISALGKRKNELRRELEDLI
jgi:hypothetical protein